MSTTRTQSHSTENNVYKSITYRFICPKCHNTCLIPLGFTSNMPQFAHCDCGQSFGMKWTDKTQDVQIAIHVTTIMKEIDNE